MANWQFSQRALDSIAQATADVNIFHGAVRSGKTIDSLFAWASFIRDAPDGDMLMSGRTERTLQRNVLEPLRSIVKPSNYSLNRSLGEITVFGRRIYIVGASDERATEKIQGMTLIGGYGDEISLYPQSFYDMFQTRLSLNGARFIGTTNPASPNHWLKASVIDNADGDFIREFHFVLEDNIALPPRYVARLKSFYQEGSLFYKRFILGQWVVAEGAVYDFFDTNLHVKPLPSRPPTQRVVSIDYGTANAFVACLIARYRPPHDGAKFVLDRTLYYDGRANGAKTDAQYLKMLVDWLGDDAVSTVIIDPSALSFKTQLLQAGFNVISANNDVLNGIRTQASMLQNGEFYLSDHPSNKPVIDEFGAYLWDTKAQARGEDKPIKAHDHSLDAIRYALHTMNKTADLHAWQQAVGVA